MATLKETVESIFWGDALGESQRIGSRQGSSNYTLPCPALAAFQLRWASRTPAISEADPIAFLNLVTRRRTKKFPDLWAEFLRQRKRAPVHVAADVPLLVACPLNWFRRLQQRLAPMPAVLRGTKGARA